MIQQGYCQGQCGASQGSSLSYKRSSGRLPREASALWIVHSARVYWVPFTRLALVEVLSAQPLLSFRHLILSADSPRKELFSSYLGKVLEELRMFTSSHSLVSFTFNLIRNSLSRTSMEQSNKTTWKTPFVNRVDLGRCFLAQ